MLCIHSHDKSPAAEAAAGVMSAEVESQLLRTLATLCCVEASLAQLHEVKLMRLCVLVFVPNESCTDSHRLL